MLSSPNILLDPIKLTQLKAFSDELLLDDIQAYEKNNEIIGIASLSQAKSGQLSFYNSSGNLNDLKNTQASWVIVPQNKEIDYSQYNFTPIYSPNPYHSIVQILDRFYQDEIQYPKPSIASDCKIHPSAVVLGELEHGVRVGANTVINSGVKIGTNTIIDDNVSIYSNVEIGENCHIFSGSVIGQRGFGFYLNSLVNKMKKVPHFGGVSIANGVEIGAQNSIASGFLEPTRIGDYSCFDSYVHIGHNAQVGKNVYLAAHVALAGRAVLNDNVQIGGGSKVDNGVVMGKGSILAAMSAATTDVKPETTVAGFPAQEISKWRKMMVKLRNL